MDTLKEICCKACGAANLIKSSVNEFYCISCGEKNSVEGQSQLNSQQTNAKKPTKEPKAQDGKKKRAALKIGIPVAIAIALGIAGTLGVAVPAYNASQGDAAMESGDYEAAAEFYSKASFFGNEGSKATLARKAHSYEQGVYAFQNAGKSVDKFSYAASFFEEADDYEDAQTYKGCCDYIVYKKAGNKSKAKKALKAAYNAAFANDGKLKLGSSKAAVFLTAKEEYSKKNYETAEKLWGDLPEEYSLLGTSAKVYLAQAKLIGTWRVVKWYGKGGDDKKWQTKTETDLHDWGTTVNGKFYPLSALKLTFSANGKYKFTGCPTWLGVYGEEKGTWDVNTSNPGNSDKYNYIFDKNGGKSLKLNFSLEKTTLSFWASSRKFEMFYLEKID